jgi:hypothetical protein
MDPISVLPNEKIHAQGEISRIFLDLGITRFQAACAHVQAMPYGLNSNREKVLALFQEGYGNCTTKHGAIARLAQELRLPVYKNLGFYRLDESIVTGVAQILAPYNLPFLPQIHCFLEYQTYWVDLTEGNCNGKNKKLEVYDFVIRVKPELTEQQELNYYRTFLQQYFHLAPALGQVEESTILQLLAACNRQVNYQCSLMAA